MQPSLNKLPQYSTSLIGRNRVATTLVELFQDAATRLVTLIGSSGTGKTRLGLEVAESMRDTFRDGRYFVNLAPVTNPVFVLPTIAQTLGIRETGDESLLDSLADFLRGKAALLILDNFEQVKGAAGELTRLIDRTDAAKFMVTSQIALDLPVEREFVVPPLEVPENANLTPEELLEYSAIALFVDRMKSVQPRFTLTAKHAPAVVDICRQVQGLPLAIELIAAHSASLSPADLLMLVRNYLALGGRGRNDAAAPGGSWAAPADRRQILYPVLDWCFSRLAVAQQTLFMRLGVFVGGCTSDAVAALYGAVGEGSFDAAGGIDSLRQKHLVLEETLAGQEPRYIMLDAIREYAHQRLHKRKEHKAINNQHCDYYVALSETAKTEIAGPNYQIWVNRLLSEIHNIRAALQWALAQKRNEAALRLCSNLLVFWHRQGYLTEGRRWLTMALEHRDGVPQAVIGSALNAAGVMAWGQSEYDEARALLEAALAIRAANRDVDTARTLNNLGLVAYEQGSHEPAGAYFEQALALYRELGEQTLIAITLNNLGLVEIDRGNLAHARQLYEEVLAIFRASGNSVNLPLPLSNLGFIDLLEERYTEAQPLLEEGLACCRETKDRNGLGYFLANLAWSMRGQGRLDRAREFALEGLTVRKDAQSKAGILVGMRIASEILAQGGQFEAAARIWGGVCRLFDELAATPVWYDQQQQTAIETTLAAALGAERFEQLKAAGASLGIDEVIEILRSATLQAEATRNSI